MRYYVYSCFHWYGVSSFRSLVITLYRCFGLLVCRSFGDLYLHHNGDVVWCFDIIPLIHSCVLAVRHWNSGAVGRWNSTSERQQNGRTVGWWNGRVAERKNGTPAEQRNGKPSKEEYEKGIKTNKKLLSLRPIPAQRYVFSHKFLRNDYTDWPDFSDGCFWFLLIQSDLISVIFSNQPNLLNLRNHRAAVCFLFFTCPVGAINQIKQITLMVVSDFFWFNLI